MRCSKLCGRDAVEGQRYCNACRAEYMREYRLRAAHRRERADFFRGAEAFRLRVLLEFRANVGWKEITGFRAANIIETLAVQPRD